MSINQLRPVEEDDSDFEISASIMLHNGNPMKRNVLANDTQRDTPMWSIYNGIHFFPCEETTSGLPPGQFIFSDTERGVAVTKKEVELDNLIRFPDGQFDEVMDDIERFWAAEDKFRRFGLLWKRGILLTGPQGSGKTSLIQIVAKMISDRGGISVYIDSPDLASRGLNAIRRVEKTKPIVAIMEDLDAIIRHNSESSVLALLDGELQVDNILFLATTNFPEKLGRRIMDRPSRFDLIKEIGMPTASTREIYLKSKNLGLTDSEMEDWIEKTNGFSLAHLRELIVSVFCHDRSLEETIGRLREMTETRMTSDDFEGSGKRPIGFSSTIIKRGNGTR